MNTSKPENKNEDRRKLIKMLGVGAGMVAGASLIAPFQASAATGRHNTLNVVNVAALAGLEELVDGDIIFVGGYRSAGDGGAKVMRYCANSTKADNGGTVHAYKSGRFELVHDGVCDFSVFGIFGTEAPADDAFDAMAADPQIHEISAHSDLNFVRRHTITRGNLTLDFHNHRVQTVGIEAAAITPTHKMELCPLFLFTGSVQSSLSVNLTSPHYEYTDCFETNSSGKNGDWFILTGDRNPDFPADSKEAIEIERLVRLNEVLPSGKWCLDYRPAFTIKSGRTLYFAPASPIQNITVRNMCFEGNALSAADLQTKGVHPVAFYCAAHCDVINLHSKNTYAAAIMRWFNSYYKTENCSLTNPPDIESGGRGYLTQQLYCNYGSVKNCKASHARHLCDFTGSSYMLVENNHANYDRSGAFVTHGQFEHDLTYIGNSGLMSFGNSGEMWGACAKNISVKRHSGCNINGGCNGGTYRGVNYGNRIINLTVEDCHIKEDKTFSNSELAQRVNGVMTLNCDGISVKNCSAENMLYMVGRSNECSRPNVISDSTFSLNYSERGTGQSPYLTLVGDPEKNYDRRISEPITFRSCTFDAVSSVHFFNRAPLAFENCTFRGKPGVMEFSTYDLSFSGCKFEGTAIALKTGENDRSSAPASAAISGTAVQKVTLRDCSFVGAGTLNAITVSPSSVMPALLELSCVDYRSDGALIEASTANSIYGVKISGCTLCGGATSLTAAENYCILTGNFTKNHTLRGLPAFTQAVANTPAITVK